jgi:hypothetical protein
VIGAIRLRRSGVDPGGRSAARMRGRVRPDGDGGTAPAGGRWGGGDPNS